MKIIKSIVLVVALLCSITTTAHDFEVDGIYYNITDATTKTVAVTYKGEYYYQYPNRYNGAITIPSAVTYNGTTHSVTSIGRSAFEGCTGLTSITIPNSVTSIGGSAFDGTAWYNNQADGVVYLGKMLYKYKGTMPANTSITIKDGTLGINRSAFDGCTGLTSVTIPNSVTSIEFCTFYGCTGLTSVTIPNSVTSIESGAFYGCTGLTSVTIGNSVTSI
ncbi:MAG: leucine-rich repeat domain-containing protein [Bacteroidaceae bacterium]|nr:leucine-rich repeat domain-containing protein [Bacteroidaceae bacterium]